MEFGLFYEIPVARPWHKRSELDAYRNAIAQAVLGDRVGFHSFWTVEHHFLEEFSHCSAPGVLYGAIAALTERIRIGHGVRLLLFPYNHSVRAAEAAAVLDLISNGRLELGTGRSATRAELEGFGIEPDDTRGLWREALEMIVGAWTEDVFSWHGKRFRIPPRRVIPKPLQEPHPPLWCAATSPETHGSVGENGLGLLSLTIGVPPEDLAGRIKLCHDGVARAKPIGKFVNPRAATFMMVHCARTNEEARGDAAASFEWYARRGVEQIRTVGEWQAEKQQEYHSYAYTRPLVGVDFQGLSIDFLHSTAACIVGDPDTCIETAKRYKAAGCDLLLCLVQPWNIPHENVMQSIELLGKHVIPQLS